MAEPFYPDEVVLIDELHSDYWFALADDIAEMRRLAGLMRQRGARA